MPIVHCPTCGVAARAPGAGRYQCPKCGAILDVAPATSSDSRDPSSQEILDRRRSPVSFYRRFLPPKYRHLGIVWIIGLVNIPVGLIAAICLSTLTVILPSVWYILLLVPFTCWWSIRATVSILSLKHVPFSVALSVLLGSLVLCGGGGFFIGVLSHVDWRDFVHLSLDPIGKAIEMELAIWVLSTIAGLYLGSFVAVQTLVQVDRLQSSPSTP